MAKSAWLPGSEDEAQTRERVDAQLREAGWEVDSRRLRHALGARPSPGRNVAIAEWPTASGPADYLLFLGLQPVAVVEAKRESVDVPASLGQAERYSQGCAGLEGLAAPGGPWGEHRLPFAYASNGRPFLRQIATKSGIWFRDLRKAENLARELKGWHTPQGLADLLAMDDARASQRLAVEPFEYGFTLRDYQREAVLAVEAALARGERRMLLAMATGTGKTKTCIALVYRLLKAQRFRRVLFLVDRSALGEQAAGVFKGTRMDGLQTFADIFGLQEIDTKVPDPATAVHIATVQGMVQRVLTSEEPPPIDAYDCIVVDECHRGYLLDRELSDDELTFRSPEEYLSSYRRVLDYFDAVKVGLTATPALHTTEIFGRPIFTYSYREAVIDGYLLDHEPPLHITTELARAGIEWQAGEEVAVLDPGSQQLELFTTPDDLHLEVEAFNRKVFTEPFNRVVCETLARELDPASREKTLIFCVHDAHADQVVYLLKQAFAARYGAVDDAAVVKITGKAPDPLGLIRRFKNEALPNVAVTVDLLTTGIDVPEICNLVFLRRVNSRILYEQMLGRATRPCEAIGKEVFRIFDPVRLYEALQNVTSMQPVVVNPTQSFAQLFEELARAETDEQRTLVREQLIAKLRRKARRLPEGAREAIETALGGRLEDVVAGLAALPLGQLPAWLDQASELAAILDRGGDGAGQRLLVSEHPDRLLGTTRGYGNAERPEDYLEAFAQYLRTHGNEIPALVTVLTRPRDLTRQQLRELALALDRAGFSETNLKAAWREMTNQDLAARIVGYVRQAALGDPLVPYDQRVDRALRKVLSSGTWSTQQEKWLQKIAAQTHSNGIVDRAALDDQDQLFAREGGGFNRLDRIFDGRLEEVLGSFNEALWEPAA